MFISEIVILEINKTKDSELKNKMLSELKKHNIIILDYNEEVDNIARIYIESKIIPEQKIEDALHVAYVTFYNIDILLSWNFKHLANIKKEHKIIIENMKIGYNYPIRLLSPLEVQDEKEI